jgi:hypothetical protein
MADEIKKQAVVETEGTPISIMTEVVRQVVSQGASVASIAALQSMFADGKLTPDMVLAAIHERGGIFEFSLKMKIPQTTGADGVIHPEIPLGGGEEVITLQPGLFDIPEQGDTGPNGIH